jgi:hypothetical protein
VNVDIRNVPLLRLFMLSDFPALMDYALENVLISNFWHNKSFLDIYWNSLGGDRPLRKTMITIVQYKQTEKRRKHPYRIHFEAMTPVLELQKSIRASDGEANFICSLERLYYRTFVCILYFLSISSSLMHSHWHPARVAWIVTLSISVFIAFVVLIVT